MGKRKLILGETDLATTHPELLKEWNYEKNIDVTPQSITSGCSKKVWWRCKEGHEWSTVVYSRTSNKTRCGCPYCGNQKLLVGYNDLATTHPDIAAEWNYEKNYPLTPQDIIRGAHNIVWWKCKDGHEWRASVSDRVSKKSSCPVELGKQIEKGYNDLLSQRPDIVKYWDYDKNYPLQPDEVAVYSGKKAHWVCPDCGHTWRTQISSRSTKKVGNCPKCVRGLKTSYAEQFIYFCIKELYSDAENRYLLEGKEADVYVPSLNLAIEYDGHHFHKGKESQIRDSKKTKHFHKLGVGFLRIKEVKKSTNIELNENVLNIPLNENKIDFLTEMMESILVWINKKYDLNLELKIPDDIDRLILEQLAVLDKNNSLEAKFPEVAAYFHPTLNGNLRADSVASQSHLVVWWLCKVCNEAYQMEIATRVRHKRNDCICKKCAKLKAGEGFARAAVIPGKTDISSSNPDLLLDWDYEKNVGIDPNCLTAKSNKRVYWKCHICDEEWDNTIHKENKKKGRGCNKCRRERK